MRDDGKGCSFAGAMISHDPVAVDSATIDFCEKYQLLPEIDVQQIRNQVDVAQAVGVGTAEYKIEKVAY